MAGEPHKGSPAISRFRGEAPGAIALGMPAGTVALVQHPTQSASPADRLAADAATTAALVEFATSVRRHGGRAVVVGGAVRDMVRAQLTGTVQPAKDVDIEVFGLELPQLSALLPPDADTVGADFQVFKVPVPGAQHPLDVSLPRKERSVGPGHRDFLVSADPYMTFDQASSRRDFTIGALGFDPLTGELLDPHGGVADLRAGVLRHVSSAFSEDPLRVLRAARFAARFGLALHDSTVDLCRSLVPRSSSISPERVWGELAATFTQAPRPGEFLRVMADVGWMGSFPEVQALMGVEQDPAWHPEGDVFVHTAHALDFVGQHLRTSRDEDDLVLATAVMCHDLGKAGTTQWRDGRWRAHGHEAAGEPPTRALLERFGQVRLADAVVPLVRDHLAPVQLAQADASASAVRRLAARVPRLDLLALVAVADSGGRPPLGAERGWAARDWLMGRVRELGLQDGAPSRLARGEHLVDLGLAPGPVFKHLLDQAYEAQLDGVISTEQEARQLLEQLVAALDQSPAQATHQGVPEVRVSPRRGRAAESITPS